jgi:hypothetical protein
LPPDREKILTSQLTLLQIKVDAETMVILNEIKSLLSHQIVDGNLNAVIKYIAQVALAQIKKKKGLSVKKEKAQERASGHEITESVPTSVNPCVNRSRYISVKVRRTVFKRAEGRCENIHANSGQRCESKYQLEYDHKKPYSQGGTNDLDNIDLKCRICNSFR